jgi:hypothetical protein
LVRVSYTSSPGSPVARILREFSLRTYPNLTDRTEIFVIPFPLRYHRYHHHHHHVFLFCAARSEEGDGDGGDDKLFIVVWVV